MTGADGVTGGVGGSPQPPPRCRCGAFRPGLWGAVHSTPTSVGFEESLIKLDLVSGVKPRSCMDLYPIF